ncbi:MAG: hypothetical protein ACJAXI_003293 [Crocinitomicaceae bacterium]|jgi:hypothetical protein
MKNLKFLTTSCLIIACASLAMPYSKFLELGYTDIFYGHDYVLTWVSMFMFFLITLVSWVKRSRTVALLGLLLSMSNIFFSIFIMITMTVFRSAHSNFEFEYMNGMWVLLFAAVSVLIASVFDVVQTFKKNL